MQLDSDDADLPSLLSLLSMLTANPLKLSQEAKACTDKPTLIKAGSNQKLSLGRCYVCLRVLTIVYLSLIDGMQTHTSPHSDDV